MSTAIRLAMSMGMADGSGWWKGGKILLPRGGRCVNRLMLPQSHYLHTLEFSFNIINTVPTTSFQKTGKIVQGLNISIKNETNNFISFLTYRNSISKMLLTFY